MIIVLYILSIFFIIIDDNYIVHFIQVRRYKRLTELSIENSALQTLDNVHPGDCIVCFSKRDIHHVSREIERRGHEVAVIYGGLCSFSLFCMERVGTFLQSVA